MKVYSFPLSDYSELASRLAKSASEHLGDLLVSCYLLGSCARGEERPGVSDVDVLLVTQGKEFVPTWERLPSKYSFVGAFSKEAERLAKEGAAPRSPLRNKVLILTVIGRKALKHETNGMLYFDLKEAKMLAGEDVRGDLRRPSWSALDANLFGKVSRWRERMLTNLLTLDVGKEPHRLASYAVMYSLPTAAAYITLGKRKMVMSKKDIPDAFAREFPRFKSSSVLYDVLDEYLNWKSRDDDFGRLASLWVRSLKFLLEIQQNIDS